MQAKVKDQRPKVPLSAALLTVSEILRAVEEDDVEALEQLYQDENFVESAKADFKSAVDRRILADRAFKAAIRMAEDAAKEWVNRVKTIKKAHDSMKQNTLFHITAHPEVKFVGNEGSLKIAQNGGKPAVKLSFETDKLQGIITDEDIFRCEIPPECYEEMSVKVLLKDKLVEHIKRNSDQDLEPLNTKTKTYLAKHKAGELTRGVRLSIGAV